MFIMISLSLLGEEDRNYEFVSMGVGGRREKSVCVFVMIFLSPGRGG